MHGYVCTYTHMHVIHKQLNIYTPKKYVYAHLALNYKIPYLCCCLRLSAFCVPSTSPDCELQNSHYIKYWV